MTDKQGIPQSALSESWMACHSVRAALFPAKAADLNPIENVWGILSRRVFAGTKTYPDAESLHTAIKAAWASFQADKKQRAKLVEIKHDCPP